MTELVKLLQGWMRWWRLRQALAWGLYGLAGGLAFALGLAVLLLADGRLLPATFARLAFLGPLAGLGLGALLALAWPMPLLAAARSFDRRLGLQERVSTALELHAALEPGQPEGTATETPAGPGTEIPRRQLADALAAARKVEVRRQLPLRLPLPALAVAGLLALGLVVVGRMGAPQMQAALQAQALEQAVERAIAGEEERLEEAIRRIEQNPELTDEQRQELIAPLEEARRRLREASTPEQAVSALTEAQGRLQAQAEQAEARAAGQEQALRQAGESLRQSQNEALREAGESLAAGDPAAAARALEGLDASALSAGEREGLAEQLEAAASSLEASNPTLAQELREGADALRGAANALREGNAQAAQESLERAAQELAEAGEAAQASSAQAQAAQQAAGNLAQGQQAVAQAAPGQGGQQGAGSGAGQGEGSQAGSGAGQGEGNGAAEPGGEVGSAPIEQGNRPGDGGEETYAPVYAPEHLGGDDGPDVGLPGNGDPGQPVGPEQTVPGAEGPSQVPYNEVFPTYAEAYRQAIESGQVPPSLQDVVRDYFSALNPEGN